MSKTPIKRIAYPIAEVAAMTGRDPSTIWRWLNLGILKSVPVPGRRQLVSAASLEKLLQGRAAIDRLKGKSK